MAADSIGSITWRCGSPYWLVMHPSAWFVLHPGPALSDSAAILRFAARATGNDSLAAQFFFGDSDDRNASLVVHGNSAVPTAALGSINSHPIFSVPALLPAAVDPGGVAVGNAGSHFGGTHR